jgi:hypothetical protein
MAQQELDIQYFKNRLFEHLHEHEQPSPDDSQVGMSELFKFYEMADKLGEEGERLKDTLESMFSKHVSPTEIIDFVKKHVGGFSTPYKVNEDSGDVSDEERFRDPGARALTQFKDGSVYKQLIQDSSERSLGDAFMMGYLAGIGK